MKTDAQSRVLGTLERRGFTCSPTSCEHEYIVRPTEERREYYEWNEVTLSIPQREIEKFLRRNRGDLDLLVILIDEELSTDGARPKRVELRSSWRSGARIVSSMS